MSNEDRKNLPEDLEFEEIKHWPQQNGDGPSQPVTQIRKLRLGTEDLIAIGCVIVAVMIVFGVWFGWIPAEMGLTAVGTLIGGGVVTQVVKAKRKNKNAGS